MAQRTRASLGSADLSEEISPNATSARARRSHRKSRNGCMECKHRHIRCDERRPSCANCEVAERLCSFLTPPAGQQRPKQIKPLQHRVMQQHQPQSTAAALPSGDVGSDSNEQSVHDADQEYTASGGMQNEQPDLGQVTDQPSRRSLPPHYALPPLTNHEPHQSAPSASPVRSENMHTPSADCCPGLLVTPDITSNPVFTPQHMVLFHNAIKVPNFIAPNRNALEIAIRYIAGSPYLMDEILAFTAFHLAYLYPGSAAHLRHLATELQSRALASFTRLTEKVPHDDRATAVPRFFFSAILGRHVLADTLTYCHSDFHFLIDRFVECINLNRGIRVVAPPAWEFLYDSEIRPFLSVIREAEQKIISPGKECDPLSRLMDDSDLNEISVKACRQAISVLQWAFDICHNLDEEDYPQSASAFSVRIGSGYVDVLRKYRPEALVILAYYGVLLHRCHSFWAFGNAGAALIRAIAGHLGSYWQDALAWPLHVLQTEHNPMPMTIVPEHQVLTIPLFMLNRPSPSQNVSNNHEHTS